VLVTGYGATAGTLWTTLPTVLILCPAICNSFDPLRSTWMASGL